MPQIMQIKDLRDTNKISEICKSSDEPIFITKNGYGDMVVMSVEVYEKKLALLDVYQKLAHAELQIKEGKVLDAEDVFMKLKEKYGF